MNGRSHAIIGAAAGLTVVIYHAIETGATISPAWSAVTVALATAAALMPDLDSTDTTARTKFGLGKQQIKREWRKRPRLSLVGRWFVSIQLNFFAWLMPHRGPTHWLATAAALIFILYTLASLLQLPLTIPLAFGAGYLSHLLADGLTVAGVPLFGPVSRRPVHLLPRLLRFRTGGMVEQAALLLILAALFAFTMSRIIT